MWWNSWGELSFFLTIDVDTYVDRTRHSAQVVVLYKFLDVLGCGLHILLPTFVDLHGIWRISPWKRCFRFPLRNGEKSRVSSQSPPLFTQPADLFRKKTTECKLRNRISIHPPPPPPPSKTSPVTTVFFVSCVVSFWDSLGGVRDFQTEGGRAR
jgi:hypothetical protein